MIGPSERERLRELLQQTNLTEIEDLVLQRSHPMILLGLQDLTVREQRRSLADMPIGASRWGAAPDLPRGFTWPVGRDDHPMHFLMQLDLASLPTFDGRPLPAVGRLYFFAGMTNEDYAISMKVQYSAAGASTLVRTAAPEFDDDLYLEYFPSEFEPFLLMGSLGIDIQYRDDQRVDLIDLIEARYPREHWPSEHWKSLLDRYAVLSNQAADVRHAQLESSGYPRQWWQVGQLFGATNPEHEQESQQRYADRSRAARPARWRQLASLESNSLTGFSSLADARPYRLLTREPAQTPWTQFDIESHDDMG